jgi:hypothetical protein
MIVVETIPKNGGRKGIKESSKGSEFMYDIL